MIFVARVNTLPCFGDIPRKSSAPRAFLHPRVDNLPCVELHDHDYLRCLIEKTMDLTNHRRISGKLETSSCPQHGMLLNQSPPKHPGNASSLMMNTRMISEKHSPSRYGYKTTQRILVDRLIQVASIATVPHRTEADTKIIITTIMSAFGLPRPTCWPRRHVRLQILHLSTYYSPR